MPPPGNTVRLRPDWDAALRYDLLEQPLEPAGGGTGTSSGTTSGTNASATAPGTRHSSLLVGREELVDALLQAVLDVEGRGTVLVSGFRGAGKTTLVIEALRRAQRAWQSADGPAATPAPGGTPMLLPVIVNVSEIATPGAPPARSGEAAGALHIEARRLLVALLRAISNRHAVLATRPQLLERVRELHRKATAVEYREVHDSRRGEERSQVDERSLTLKADDLVKFGLLPAGALAAALAAVGAAETPWGHALKAIAAAGALGSIGLGVQALRKTRVERSSAEQIRLAIAHDNSPQQLENDLKQLLADLRGAGFRTVIVLEELDKLDEAGNAELDQAIRNFKNLFTQAPALFVFVTDKAYYDRIGQHIREARRRRSYAVAHTFFTHRLFVGRPGLHDCLDCLAAMLADAADRDDVHRIYRPRPHVMDSHHRDGSGRVVANDGITPLNLLARVLLFRAQNHLFDLKSELRRYVGTQGGAPHLVLDATRFPPAQRRLARFQDLVASKHETHQMRDGRPYANEVMLGCLYRVFADMGSRAEQRVADLLIAPEGEEAELLEAEERQRIEGAVRELLSDLARGRVLVLKAAATPEDPGTYQWQPENFDDFLPARTVERHESELIAELRRVAAQAEAVLAFDALEPTLQAAAREARGAMLARAERLVELAAPIGVDEAQQELRQAQQWRDRLFGALADRVRQGVAQRWGLVWADQVIGEPAAGQGAWVLRSARDGSNPGLGIGLDSALGGGAYGVVLLAVGDLALLRGPVLEFLARHSPTGWARLAVVHLLLVTPGAVAGAADVVQLHEQWRALADAASPAGSDAATLPMPLLFSGLRVGQPAGPDHAEDTLRTGSEAVSTQLLRALVWASPPDPIDAFFLPETLVLRDAEALAPALQPAVAALQAGEADVLVLEATARLVPRLWLAAQALMARPEFAGHWVLPAVQGFQEGDDLDRLLVRAANRVLLEHLGLRPRPPGGAEGVEGRNLLGPQLRQALRMPGGLLLLRRELAAEAQASLMAYREMAARAADFEARHPQGEVALPEGVALMVCGSVERAGFEPLGSATAALAPVPTSKGQAPVPGHGPVTLQWGRRVATGAPLAEASAEEEPPMAESSESSA